VTGLFCVKRVPVPKRSLLLVSLKTKWTYWTLYGQMGLIRILGEDDCISLLYVKGGANYKKCSFIGHNSRQNGHFWPHYGQMW